LKIIRSNKKGHRIHSPFVYRLVTSVLFGNTVFSAIEKSEDFKIDKVEKLWLTLLFRLLNEFQPEKIICMAEISENIIQLMKNTFAGTEFIFPETKNKGEIQTAISTYPFVIADENSFQPDFKFKQNSVWFIKKNNKRGKSGQFFQTLPELENGRITIELTNAVIVIVDNKFPSQDYVIKQRGLLPIYKKD
jgi:hypothetical protein